MTGIMNPITGLIVLPTKVIASPIFGIAIARPILITISTKVQSKFYRFVIPSSLYNNSSIVSFDGRTQRGAAQITANKSENVPT